MVQPSVKPDPIVRRWKRIFLGIYLAYTCGAGLLALFSILAVHCGAYHVPIKGKRIHPQAKKTKELRNCYKKLERLMTDLHQETLSIQAKALQFDVNPSVEWRNWSQSWRRRWRNLDWSCRLSDLSGQGVSPEIDQMAAIHLMLDEIHRSYADVINDRLFKLHKKLIDVQKMIDRKKPGISSPKQARSHGAKR